MTSAGEDRLLIYGNVILSGAGGDAGFYARTCSPLPATSERQALFPAVIYRGSFSASPSSSSCWRYPPTQRRRSFPCALASVLCKVYTRPPCCCIAAGAPNISGCSSERIRNDNHKMCVCRAGSLSAAAAVCRWRGAAVSNRCPADLRLCLLFFSLSLAYSRVCHFGAARWSVFPLLVAAVCCYIRGGPARRLPMSGAAAALLCELCSVLSPCKMRERERDCVPYGSVRELQTAYESAKW